MFNTVDRFNVFWRSFGREERWALVTCAVLVLLCAGIQHAQPAASLGPVFVAAPGITKERVSRKESSRAARAELRVHVAGAVKRPGVQSLPAGARVIDAVNSAGGATNRADVQVLNLAAHLQDGEQVVIPLKGRTVQSTVTPSDRLRAEPHSSMIRVTPLKALNVNTATAAELEELPGIGPALAERIVRYREEKGRLGSLQDLDAVKGLGEKKLEKIQPYVVF